MFNSKLQEPIRLGREAFAQMPADKLADAATTLDMTPDDHFRFQVLQSNAHAAGRLDTDTAQHIFGALGVSHNGENGGWSAETDIATKYVVMLALKQLAKEQVEAAVAA